MDYRLLEGLQLQVPVAFPYVITGRFGEPRNYSWATHRLQEHEGVDFAPRERSWPFLGVLPALAGRVIKVGYDRRGYGNYLVLKHVYRDQELLTWYAHMKAIYHAEGAQVQNLWLLGEAGDTGFATGAHLHFTLACPGMGRRGYVVDWVLDPTPFFREGYRP